MNLVKSVLRKFFGYNKILKPRLTILISVYTDRNSPLDIYLAVEIPEYKNLTMYLKTENYDLKIKKYKKITRNILKHQEWILIDFTSQPPIEDRMYTSAPNLFRDTHELCDFFNKKLGMYCFEKFCDNHNVTIYLY